MKEMLEKKLEELELEYLRNENKDRGYDFNLAKTLKAEIAKIEKKTCRNVSFFMKNLLKYFSEK